MSLIITLGAIDADSYVEADVAQDWAGKLPWGQSFSLETNTDTVEQFLRQAANLMQSRPWRGSRIDATQLLDWPRYGVVNPDYDLVEYAQDSLPTRVWHGQVEWAVFLYKFRQDPTIPAVTEAFDEVTVGPIKVRSKGSGGATRSFSKAPQQTTFIKERLAMPPQVARHLSPLLLAAGGPTYIHRIS